MTKKLAALLLAMLLFCGVMAGCGQGTTTYTSIWFSVDDPDEGDTGTNRTRSTGAGDTKTTVPTGTGQSRPTRKPTDMVTFEPVEDKGADYSVTGTVRIAVDTVRPTDYDAMFDIMEQLYPNVTVEYDYWTHSTNDDGREYLATRSKTGTMADIMWDEAGEMPNYIMQGWVYPITKFVEKDPEAKNVPDGVMKSYTFFGEVYALPHQATIECVAINADLMNYLNLKKPGLEWTMEEYEALLRGGAKGYSDGRCVAITDLFEAYHRYAFYTSNSSSANANYGTDGYNYDTKQIDVQYLALGADKFRFWRTMTTGVEAYYEAMFNKDSTGASALSSNLGITNYNAAWSSGKALIHDCITWEVSQYDNYNFNWYMWPMPNKDGNMPYHVDQCFITSGCSDENITAAYQLLRFMTMTTNGNLARLSMYEDSQKDKYTLNSYIYYPVTTNKTVIEKFKSLSCTGEAEVYILENIPNSSRYDTYGLVPEWRSVQSIFGPTTSDITDGLKTGAALAEPVAKCNEELDKAWENFETQAKKVQAEFNKTHKR